MIPIQLLYHINFNHLSLSFKQRTDYIEKYLAKILTAITVPSTISICAEDLLLLKNWNPIVYGQLVNHPKLKFVLMPYSHALPDFSPSSYFENVLIGKHILRRLIPNDKILCIGYSPEVDLPNLPLTEKIKTIWPKIIVGETRISITDTVKNTYPPLFIINGFNNLGEITCLLSRRSINYRELLHKYYRSEADPEDLYQGIIADFNNYSKPSNLLLRIDLEVLIFNKLTTSKNLNKQIQQFHNLQQALLNKGIQFNHLSDTIDTANNNFISYNKNQISASEEENYKWQKNPLLTQVNQFYLDTETKIEKIISLSLLCSDYYCRDGKDLILKNLRAETIKIVKNKRYRSIESGFKINLLKKRGNFKLLPIKFKDTNLKKYLKFFLESVNQAIQYLDTDSVQLSPLYESY